MIHLLQIYIIHFAVPMSHAQHYLGHCKNGKKQLEQRIATHRRGNGAKILKAATEKGIQWDVVAVLPGGFDEEKRLKTKLKNTRKICPLCCGKGGKK